MTRTAIITTRTDLGLTRPALASALGVSTKAVQSWELGTREIPEPVARIMRLAANDSQLLERLERVATKASTPRTTS